MQIDEVSDTQPFVKDGGWWYCGCKEISPISMPSCPGCGTVFRRRREVELGYPQQKFKKNIKQAKRHQHN